MCTSETVLVAWIPSRWQYVMSEMPLSSISYGHALNCCFSRCVRLPHPVETPHKKRAVSHLSTQRLCLAVGMCVPHHIIQFQCPQVIQVEVWPHHAAISSQLYVCPSFQWKPGCDRDELLIWSKTNLSKYLFKKPPTVTLVSISHSSIQDQQEKYVTSHQMWHLLTYPKEWDAARRCIQMQN